MHACGSADVQIRYARVAGFVYLLLIALYFVEQLLIAHVVGTGDFADRLVHIAHGQVFYRLGLVIELLLSVFTVLLAYALYVVLKPVNERLARLAMYWRLGEAFAGATMFVSFTALALQSDPAYVQSLGVVRLQAIVELARRANFASFNIAIVFFGFGSTLFYYLFTRTRYIPRGLSAFGVFASVVTLLAGLTNLVLPEFAHRTQYAFAPIFVAEIATGLWLLVRGVRIEPLAQPGNERIPTATEPDPHLR